MADDKTGCILASDLDEKMLLIVKMQEMEKKMEEMEQRMAKQQDVIQTKLGKNKTLTCSGCPSPVDDKRCFWCSTCHGEMKFDAKVIMDDAKHTNVICTECAIHEHGQHNLQNYLQQLILSCSVDFGEMLKKSKDFGENWPSNAPSISEFLENFFGEHFSKAEEMSKKCASRSAFQEFNGESHEILKKAENAVENMRNHFSEFMEEIQSCGKEFEALRNKVQLFAETEQTRSSAVDSLKSPLPVFGHPQVRSWSVNKKLTPLDIAFVFSHRRNLFVFSQNTLFHTNFHEQTHGPVTELQNDVFNGIYTATSVPDDTKIVLASQRNRKEFVIFDFSAAKILQKTPVDDDILEFVCSRDNIVVTTSTYKILLFSKSGAEPWQKVREFQGYPDQAKPSISSGGMLAYVDNSESYLRIYNVKENTGGETCINDWFNSMLINDSATFVLCDDNGSYLNNIDVNTKTCSNYLQHSFGSLLNLASDDDRCFLFEKNSIYTIANIKIEKDKAPELLFSFEIPSTPIFEESFAFLRFDGIQHLQFVTKEGLLMRYKIDEANKTWRAV